MPCAAWSSSPHCLAPWPLQVTDGSRVLRAANGVPMLQQITATGCSGGRCTCAVVSWPNHEMRHRIMRQASAAASCLNSVRAGWSQIACRHAGTRTAHKHVVCADAPTNACSDGGGGSVCQPVPAAAAGGSRTRTVLLWVSVSWVSTNGLGEQRLNVLGNQQSGSCRLRGRRMYCPTWVRFLRCCAMHALSSFEAAVCCGRSSACQSQQQAAQGKWAVLLNVRIVPPRSPLCRLAAGRGAVC